MKKILKKIQLPSWYKSQQESRRFDLEAIRCCCALADMENSIEENQVSSLILSKIAAARGVKQSEINKIIDELKRTEPRSNCMNGGNTKPTLLKARIIRVLYNMVRIILADHREMHEEKLLFHFICVKMNILNAYVRQRIYDILKQFAEINLKYPKAVDDFANKLSVNIREKLGVASEVIFSVSFETKLKDSLLGKKGNCGTDIYEACIRCFDEEYVEIDNNRVGLKTGRKVRDDFSKQINSFLNYKRFRKKDFYNNITDKDCRDFFSEDADLKCSIIDIERKLIGFAGENLEKQKMTNELLQNLLAELICKEECVDVVSRDEELCGCIDESTIDIRSLNSSETYSTAIINLEQEKADKTYEFRKLKQINRDLSRLDEFLLNRYFQTNKTPKDIALLFFDFYSVIIADNIITIDEKILLKIFSHIYNVNVSQYQYIFSELNKIYNETLDDTYKAGGDRINFIDNFWRRREIAVRNIRRELENSCHIKAEKSFRFALVCSLAYVDGKIADIEKSILYDIGIRDYNLSISEIEKIFIQFDESQEKTNDLHIELLCNIPTSSKERKRDLDNCKRVISADGSVTEAERCAFKMVCLFYGVKDWEKVCLGESIDLRYRRLEDKKRRVLLSKSNYEEIKEVLDKEVINEPLKSGIKSALIKRHAEQKRRRTRRSRATTIYAFALFVISAIVLYSYATYIVHHSHIGSDETANSSYVERFSESSIFKVHDNPYNLMRTNLEKIADSIDNENNYDWVKISISVLVVFISLVVIFVYRKRLLQLLCYLGRLPLVHPKTILSLVLILLGLFMPFRYYLSMLLLIMMLSIEWLILMRETKNTHHSKLLALLVVMAIVTDLAFGMLELNQDYADYAKVLDKVFSALFTGCICFFTGKFMELTYSHTIEDEREQEEIVKNIVEKYSFSRNK